MTTIDNVISRQNDLFGVISRAVENLNKLGSSRMTRGNVKSRLEALKSNWEKFQNYHESLYKARSAETCKLSYFADNLYSLCEEKFLESHGTLSDMLDSFEMESRQNPTPADVSTNSCSNTNSRQLPRIELPKFSGDYSQWSQFRDLFTSMIISNNELAAVEKLHYLKMSLFGESSQMLKNLTVSGENFTRAWDTLVTRYENKRILIDSQLSALFATRKVKTECSDELKRLFGDVKEALGALEALDCPVNHWNHIVVFMVVRKLDAESLKDWEKTLGANTTPPSFADLEKFLNYRIHTLEALERSTMSRKQQHSASNSSRSISSV